MNDFSLLFLALTVLSFVPVEKNYETVIVNKGGGTVLKCITVKEALGCSFISPEGKNYNMLRDAAYEQGRIQQEELNFNDCAVKITDIREYESGKWECSVTVKVGFCIN